MGFRIQIWIQEKRLGSVKIKIWSSRALLFRPAEKFLSVSDTRVSQYMSAPPGIGCTSPLNSASLWSHYLLYLLSLVIKSSWGAATTGRVAGIVAHFAFWNPTGIRMGSFLWVSAKICGHHLVFRRDFAGFEQLQRYTGGDPEWRGLE